MIVGRPTLASLEPRTMHQHGSVELTVRGSNFLDGALAPGVHYEPFWTTSATDVLDVLANVSHPSSDARMRRVARAGQAFVHRHLNAVAGGHDDAIRGRHVAGVQ